MMNLFFNMAKDAYRQWYDEKVSPNLDADTKQKVVMRISDLTLEHAIWDDRVTNYISQFPELAPYVSKGLDKISGLQLVAVMEGIFHELHPEAKF